MDITELGNNIVRLLQEKGIAAKTMADDIGVSKNFVRGLVKGEGNPTLQTIQKIADYLGTTPKILLYGDVDAVGTLSRDATKLLRRYNMLDEDGQDVVRVAALNELRRMQQEGSLGVVANLESHELGLGREAELVHTKEGPSDISRPQQKDA